MNTLDFIEDGELRKTLEGAIEFIFALHEISKAEGRNPLYQEEMCRVIILYVISAIEAVLLYFYKVRGEKIERPEYRYVHQLPLQYSHNVKSPSRVVIAVQEDVTKKEYEIGLQDLVVFFKDKKLILKQTAEKILELNDVRNTLHFSKRRDKKCDLSRVEDALALLVYVLEKAPTSLKKYNVQGIQ